MLCDPAMSSLALLCHSGYLMGGEEGVNGWLLQSGGERTVHAAGTVKDGDREGSEVLTGSTFSILSHLISVSQCHKSCRSAGGRWRLERGGSG